MDTCSIIPTPSLRSGAADLLRGSVALILALLVIASVIPLSISAHDLPSCCRLGACAMMRHPDGTLAVTSCHPGDGAATPLVMTRPAAHLTDTPSIRRPSVARIGYATGDQVTLHRHPSIILQPPRSLQV